MGPELAIRGLILDKKLGNLVKVDRFGFVKRAMHGTRMLNPREMYKAYGRELVKYADTSRWKFINTLFSISEAVLFSQLVDRLDSGYLPEYVVGRSYMVPPPPPPFPPFMVMILSLLSCPPPPPRSHCYLRCRAARRCMIWWPRRRPAPSWRAS